MIAHKTGGSVVPAYTVTTTVSGIIWVQFICSEPDTRIQDRTGNVFVFGVDSEASNRWLEQTVDLGQAVNVGGYTVSYGHSIHDLDVYFTPKSLLESPSLMKFDTGDVVEIVANTFGHPFSHGQVLVVFEQQPEVNGYIVKNVHGLKAVVSEDDIVRHKF